MQTAACMLSMQSSSWSKSKGMLHARLRWLCFEQTSPFSADSKKSIQCWVDNYIRQSLLDSWIHRTQVMRCCQKLVIPCRITKSQMLIHEHASVTAVRFLQYQSSNNNPSCTPASFTATIQTVLQYTDLQLFQHRWWQLQRCTNLCVSFMLVPKQQSHKSWRAYGHHAQPFYIKVLHIQGCWYNISLHDSESTFSFADQRYQ